MNRPEKIVEPYANKAVMANSLPAPFPNSAIAGVTSPNIIKGMENDRKLPKRELNVTKIRAIPWGRNWPNKIPAPMAMTTWPNNEIFNFFIVFLINTGIQEGCPCMAVSRLVRNNEFNRMAPGRL